MTDEELAAIEARANAATPGPWEFDRIKAPTGPDYAPFVCTGDRKRTVAGAERPLTVENAEFIAHAREDIPRLIAEIRRLRATR